MRDGERLVRWLTFQDVDRPPFIQLWSAWGQTFDRWKTETGLLELDRSRLNALYNFDRGFEVVPVPLGFYPPFERRIIDDDGEYYIVKDERGITMRQRHDLGSVPGYLEHPVKGPDDWERLKKERLDPDNPGRYTANWDLFNGHLDRTGSVAQLGDFPYGLFGTARDLMGAEALLRGFYDQVDLVKDIMDYLTGFWIRIYERITMHVPVACIHMWEDMAGKTGSLISPDMVRRFIAPNYRRIWDFAQSRSIPLFSVDSDGDVSQIVPAMTEAGVNLFYPFEVQAGCDVEIYRERYPRLGIMGGIDKRALALDRQAIDREIVRAERMLRTGGYVASLDHLVPPDVPWMNHRYYVDRLRQLIFPT
jgi:hypothetical protein